MAVLWRWIEGRDTVRLVDIARRDAEVIRMSQWGLGQFFGVAAVAYVETGVQDCLHFGGAPTSGMILQ